MFIAILILKLLLIVVYLQAIHPCHRKLRKSVKMK